MSHYPQQKFLSEDFFQREFEADYGDFFDTFFEDFGNAEDIPINTVTSIDTEESSPRKRSKVSHSPAVKSESLSVERDELLRKFPKLFENGINAHDCSFFGNTLREFCVEDLTTILYFPKGNPHGVSYREMHGISVISDYFHKSLSSAPDSLLLFHSTQIVHNEDGSAVVVCKFTVNGSKLFTVTAENNGTKVPNPPALVKLYQTINKIDPKNTTKSQKIKQNKKQRSEEATSADSIAEPVLFKGPANKFDRYKKQKDNTLGTFINYYPNFCESSLTATLKGKNNTSNPIVNNNSNSNNSGNADQAMYSNSNINNSTPINNTILNMPPPHSITPKVGRCDSNLTDTTDSSYSSMSNSLACSSSDSGVNNNNNNNINGNNYNNTHYHNNSSNNNNNNNNSSNNYETGGVYIKSEASYQGDTTTIKSEHYDQNLFKSDPGTSSSSSSYPPQLIDNYKPDEIMIAREDTKFGLSALLPAPISFELYGLFKFYVNKDDKVTRIDGLTASKQIKISE